MSAQLVNRESKDPLFHHPDDCTALEQFDDAVQAVCSLQKLGPIVEGIGTQFGDITLPNIMIHPRHNERRSFAAVTWDAGRAVYLQSQILSSSIFEETTGQLWGPGIFQMDPPEHTKLRLHIQKGFTPNLVAAWEDDIIRPMMEKRFAEIRKKGQANLTRDLTAFYPYEILSLIVGFDPADIRFVADCFRRIQAFNTDPASAFAASEEIKDYSLRLIEKRRFQPKNDLVSALTLAEVDGERLEDETFVAIVTHLLQGGIDTVYKLSSNIIYLLLAHPDQFEKLKKNRSLIPQLIEEALRYEGVATMMPRVALQDTDVVGTPIPEGTVVWVIHAAINRDPARWQDPHKFDIERKPQAHMAFGNGPHACIGMHLARCEIAHFLDHVLDDLPKLRWDPKAEIEPRISGWTMRSALELPVVWDPH